MTQKYGKKLWQKFMELIFNSFENYKKYLYQ